MDFIKKNLKLIVLACAALFAVLVFATMAGTAVKATASIGSWSATAKATCYSVLAGDGKNGVAIAAFILYVFGLVAALGACAVRFVKPVAAYSKFAALGACVLLLVAGILWFCVATGDYDGCQLGAGSVLSAIFCIIAACGCGYVGAMELLNK